MIFLGIFKRKTKNKLEKQRNLSDINWPDYVVNLNEKKFEVFIEKYPLSIIDFWAPWCKPCKSMSPRLRRLSKIYKGKVAFGKINIQENKDISKKYKIMGIPHLIFFRYGEKISNLTGLKSVNDIKKNIEELLNRDD